MLEIINETTPHRARFRCMTSPVCEWISVFWQFDIFGLLVSRQKLTRSSCWSRQILFSVKDLITEKFSVDDALQAYALVKNKEKPSFGVLVDYVKYVSFAFFRYKFRRQKCRFLFHLLDGRHIYLLGWWRILHLERVVLTNWGIILTCLWGYARVRINLLYYFFIFILLTLNLL